jgi:hypothetical protein
MYMREVTSSKKNLRWQSHSSFQSVLLVPSINRYLLLKAMDENEGENLPAG